MDNHVVIMAGGIGSRFWPMSTPECPKQFIDVMGCGWSLIQLTADRFDGVCPKENMWVVTSEKYIDIVREQLPEIPESNILAEPCARNTAPCIAFACWKIKKKHPNANIVVTPSDALVIDTGEFRRVMEKALRFTDDGSAIVTIGIRPTRPETGYGYIAAADQLQTDKEIYTVDAFKENRIKRLPKSIWQKAISSGMRESLCGTCVLLLPCCVYMLRASHKFSIAFSPISIQRKKMKRSRSYSLLAKAFLSTMQ